MDSDKSLVRYSTQVSYEGPTTKLGKILVGTDITIGRFDESSPEFENTLKESFEAIVWAFKKVVDALVEDFPEIKNVVLSLQGYREGTLQSKLHWEIIRL